MTNSIRSDWINGMYDEKLEDVAAVQGVPRACVDQAFRTHCETFQTDVVDGTDASVVRQLAFHKLQWHPPERSDRTTC